MPPRLGRTGRGRPAPPSPRGGQWPAATPLYPFVGLLLHRRISTVRMSGAPPRRPVPPPRDGHASRPYAASGRAISRPPASAVRAVPFPYKLRRMGSKGTRRHAGGSPSDPQLPAAATTGDPGPRACPERLEGPIPALRTAPRTGHADPPVPDERVQDEPHGKRRQRGHGRHQRLPLLGGTATPRAVAPKRSTKARSRARAPPGDRLRSFDPSRRAGGRAAAIAARHNGTSCRPQQLGSERGEPVNRG